ncbi:G protein-coupled receptor-like protein [Leptotrombidium deliense]|uniref:G protein-coupled receptor-like protein n=1 Tax=Leptotrombidium deliense TaxID=299467 RepID=A0A443S2X6_9ACAR|nr:G protein-coupled receptor-like protein [Leptotrombidium deliense]
MYICINDSNVDCENFDEKVVNNNYLVITMNSSEEDALIKYRNELLQESLLEIIVFTIFLVFGGCGNLFVIYKLCSHKYRNSQMSYLLRHLTLADLSVIFITIIIEIVWRLTISWNAGELCCKLVLTMRTFGLYLSSLMLICISVDRYFAFVHPLSFKTVKERNCRILFAAYLSSILLSLPQFSLCLH